MAAPFGIPFTSWPQCFYVCHLIFRILSTSDISVTFAFYNGLTKGNEVRVMRKILLVDDNKAIAQELAKLLKRRGYEVQISATLAGAWVIIEKERPLFILTDSKDLETEYQYRRGGVNDYLTSPVNIPELIRRIRYFIAPQEQIQAAE